MVTDRSLTTPPPEYLFANPARPLTPAGFPAAGWPVPGRSPQPPSCWQQT